MLRLENLERKIAGDSTAEAERFLSLRLVLFLFLAYNNKYFSSSSFFSGAAQEAKVIASAAVLAALHIAPVSGSSVVKATDDLIARRILLSVKGQRCLSRFLPLAADNDVRTDGAAAIAVNCG